MKLRKICHSLLFLGIVLFSFQVSATHIVGGEIIAKYLRTDSSSWVYKITLLVYKDCGPLATGQFDDPLMLAIYDGNNNFFREDTMNLPLTGPIKLDVLVANPCLKAPPDICTELGLYEKEISLPISADGYILTYQRCCRNAGIVNIVNPGDYGATYTVRIPGTNEIGSNPNNTPYFNKYPPLVLCLNDAFTFDHSATDADGDSLVYSFCTPYNGGSKFNPIPMPPFSAPPYGAIFWAGTYNGGYQIASNPAFAIDPITGEMTGTATSVGKYVVGVCVSEYRNGVFLSENKRDFQFTVTQCDANSIAAAATQDRFCEGLTINFSNNSENAISFFWDFGEPLLTTDTSSLQEPSWTYSDTGKYIITLIANPGWPCADTVETVYEIYELLDPFFVRPEGQCFEEHSFDFEAGGLFQQYASFEWEFGNLAVTTGSFDQNPTNVRFTEPGEFPITLIIRENGCEEQYVDSVFVHPYPVPRFDVEERSGCVPIKVEFLDESQTWSNLTYEWDFGDGNTSTEQNPTHVYPLPGVYDVSLKVSSSEVCVATESILKIGFIKVNAIPEAELSVDRTSTTILDPVITFRDESKEISLCKLDLGDGIQSPFCDYSHNYLSSGKYTVTQVVYTQFGCTDTNYLEVLIRPEVSLFVPSAFTPNSDNANEIFKAYGEPVSVYDFRIYNRWGELVFRTDQLDKGWDGNQNGNPSPNDTYMYHIFLVDVLGEEHEMRGSFTLLR